LAVVTALRATRGGAVALHVDGAYVCTVSEALVARWRLHKGRELDDAALAQIREQASAASVLADAHRLLGHRARSRRELRDRLLAKGHAEQGVAATLDALRRDGLLDDAAFARSFVADKRRLSGWGAERIRRGLQALGVDGADIEAALGGPAEEGGAEELERALAVLRKLGPPRPPLEAARRRAYQALLRRGFASGLAYAAVRRWSGGPGEA
jgi:regulatory protein